MSSPVIPAVEDWVDVGRRVRSSVEDDRLVLAAAGVAFYGFLSIIPTMAVLVSVAGLVLDPDTVTERTDELFASLPDEARSLLADQLRSVASQARGTLSLSVVVGVALSLWSASSGMGHLLDGIDIAYGVRDGRGWVRRKAQAIAFTLGAVLFVVFAVTGLAGLPAILDALDAPGWVDAGAQAGFWLALLAAFVVALGVLYRYGPDRPRPPWQWISPGSVLAVAVWLVAAIGFRIYVASFGSYDASYGSLAAVAVLLTWLFVTAFVVLLGAEVNAEVEPEPGG